MYWCTDTEHVRQGAVSGFYVIRASMLKTKCLVCHYIASRPLRESSTHLAVYDPAQFPFLNID